MEESDANVAKGYALYTFMNECVEQKPITGHVYQDEVGLWFQSVLNI